MNWTCLKSFPCCSMTLGVVSLLELQVIVKLHEFRFPHSRFKCNFNQRSATIQSSGNPNMKFAWFLVKNCYWSSGSTRSMLVIGKVVSIGEFVAIRSSSVCSCKGSVSVVQLQRDTIAESLRLDCFPVIYDCMTEMSIEIVSGQFLNLLLSNDLACKVVTLWSLPARGSFVKCVGTWNRPGNGKSKKMQNVRLTLIEEEETKQYVEKWARNTQVSRSSFHEKRVVWWVKYPSYDQFNLINKPKSHKPVDRSI